MNEPLSAYLRRMNGHPELSWDELAKGVERLEAIAEAAQRVEEGSRIPGRIADALAPSRLKNLRLAIEANRPPPPMGSFVVSTVTPYPRRRHISDGEVTLCLLPIGRMRQAVVGDTPFICAVCAAHSKRRANHPAPLWTPSTPPDGTHRSPFQ